MQRRRALVVGANGQDGTFLVRHLLERGHDTTGIGLEGRSLHVRDDRYQYRTCDLRDRNAFARLLEELRPQDVFHFAAVHASAARNRYEPVFADMLDVNVKSLHAVLEYARGSAEPVRLTYAASAKCFGETLPAEIDEGTPRRSDCLYGITKNAAVDLVRYYRTAHAVPSGVVYLFNHESELRPPEFFIPKVAQALRRARDGVAEPVALHSLDFHCDWGSADEFMAMVVDALALAPGEDFVLGSGRCVFARDMVRDVFAAEGFDAEEHLEAPRREPQNAPYQVKIDRIAERLGRRPERRIEEVVRQMSEVGG
ncbi:MAG: GDP-mannose 4,6-dehydratase [Deltaproteobacteria bacterium]|jgi:GDPmannose 4,6-dehydratase|nr:GDP-mannose 4,6-dehydratase [Deltaproteobacteria bacterium]